MLSRYIHDSLQSISIAISISFLKGIKFDPHVGLPLDPSSSRSWQLEQSRNLTMLVKYNGAGIDITRASNVLRAQLQYISRVHALVLRLRIGLITDPPRGRLTSLTRATDTSPPFIVALDPGISDRPRLYGTAVSTILQDLLWIPRFIRLLIGSLSDDRNASQGIKRQGR